jgi:predicted tellurium resistance membrane protein TerC
MLLLVFISFKLIFSAFEIKLDHWVSLSVVVVILASGILYSLLVKNPSDDHGGEGEKAEEKIEAAPQENN